MNVALIILRDIHIPKELREIKAKRNKKNLYPIHPSLPCRFYSPFYARGRVSKTGDVRRGMGMFEAVMNAQTHTIVCKICGITSKRNYTAIFEEMTLQGMEVGKGRILSAKYMQDMFCIQWGKPVIID